MVIVASPFVSVESPLEVTGAIPICVPLTLKVKLKSLGVNAPNEALPPEGDRQWWFQVGMVQGHF